MRRYTMTFLCAKNGKCLQYATAELRADAEVVRAAVAQCPGALGLQKKALPDPEW